VPQLDRSRDRANGRVELRTLKAVSVGGFGFPHTAQVLQVTPIVQLEAWSASRIIESAYENQVQQQRLNVEQA
jgi:hypothetical protein